MSTSTLQPTYEGSLRAVEVGERASASSLRAHGSLDVTPRVYWALVGLIVTGFLLLWLTHFRHVYGWLMDDRFLFIKGLDTVRDWHAAFSYTNALQPYFLFISYLPLKLGLSLPSYPVPLFGERTGQFRFLLLYTVFLHAGLMLAWAWFANQVVRNRLIALASVLLLATSPTIMLWSPQPDSRLLGLPFVLAGIVLLTRPILTLRFLGSVPGGRYTLAGTAFWLAQSIHYTALYLIAPICLVYWAYRLKSGWRQAECWREVIAFGLGAVWLQAVLEAVSYFIIKVPLELSPTVALLALRKQHISPWSAIGNVQVFGEGFWTQMGPLLIVAACGGWWIYLAGTRRVPASDALTGQVTALSLPLALVYLGVSGSMPFFRQTALLQPFIMLFAGVAAVTVAPRVGSRSVWQGAALALIICAIGGPQWLRAEEVFKAHQSLGEALEWAYEHKGDRKLEWFPVAWFETPGALNSGGDLESAGEDSWVLSYFPSNLMAQNATLDASLARTEALNAWPSLYATETMRAELKGFGYDDFRFDPLLRDVRVFDAKAVRQAMAGETARVAAVRADSQNAADDEPANVLDRDASPDGSTEWRSAPAPTPHWLEVEFDDPVVVGSVQVVTPTREQQRRGIAGLEIQLADGSNHYRTVWVGDHLEAMRIIAASWQPTTVKRLKLIVQRQLEWDGADVDFATIEELVFPGYQAVGPTPDRAFPPLVLQDARPLREGLLVSGSNITSHTRLVDAGRSFAMRRLAQTGQYLVALPERMRTADDALTVYLADNFRRSNSLTIDPSVAKADAAPEGGGDSSGARGADTLAPATISSDTPIRRLRPAGTRAGRGFNLQPDGRSGLNVDAENVQPGTVILFDGVPVPTTYGNDHWLTAQVPAELYSRPGRYPVFLQYGQSRSPAIDFVVEP